MTSKAGKKPRTVYKLTLKQSKKPGKQDSWLKEKKRLEDRMKVEGETKWLVNAHKVNAEKLKKAGLV